MYVTNATVQWGSNTLLNIQLLNNSFVIVSVTSNTTNDGCFVLVLTITIHRNEAKYENKVRLHKYTFSVTDRYRQNCIFLKKGICDFKEVIY